YGKAVQRAAALAKHARKVAKPCEIEMSVDETNEDTTEADHIFVAKELKRLGVKIAAIAPKFVGSFEKGIDYKGDLAGFEASLKRHAAIAKALGGHKISVHSGSDKFSLYPIVAAACKGRFHLKTAGTSWLEALRCVCRKDPALFREICDLARARYEEDRKSYHISGRVEDVPAPLALPDDALEAAYLEDLGGRQILHVTYGSVFQSPLKPRLFDVLLREEAEHWRCVGAHLRRHVEPLAGKRPTKAARELLSRA
ncbi:MAG TPA: tagaturonate epimerase family protein, partial [Planctomycetota bacterium]